MFEHSAPDFREESCVYGDLCAKVYDSNGNYHWAWSNNCAGVRLVQYRIDTFKRKLNIQFFTVDGYKKSDASVAEFIGSFNYDAQAVVDPNGAHYSCHKK